MKLSEGEIHNFQVVKLVDIPEEGEFFVLRHESGRRVLLSSQTYRHYNIKPGKSIACKIDKVNCSGKVYLEPKHPIYKENEEYEFEVLSCNKEKDDHEYLTLIVADSFNNQIKVLVSESFELNEQKKIQLKVTRIKKGVPILIHPTLSYNSDHFSRIIGGKMLFFVKGMNKNDNNEDVYILTNNLGYSSELKVKHYQSYGFKPGDEIECTVYSHKNQKFLKVEPINPFYELGKEYNFKVVKDNLEYSDNDEDDLFLIVEDITGKKCGVQVIRSQYKFLKQKPSIKCRVIGYRKGRPKLERLNYNSGQSS
jgi:hypothetical protein